MSKTSAVRNRTKVEVASRTPVDSAANVAWIDYAVWDISTRNEKIVASTSEYSDVPLIMAEHRSECKKSGAGVPKFKVIERDFNDSRDAADQMQISEVS